MAMQYKGYTAKIEWDEDDEILHGKVIGLRDFIIFEGESKAEICRLFHEAVDEYLEDCRSRGKEPDKPYSGNIHVRLGPALHRQAALQADREGKSLNTWIQDTLASALKAQENKRSIRRGLRQPSSSEQV